MDTATLLLDASLAPNTKTAYRNGLKMAQSFLQQYNGNTDIKNMSLLQVIMYVAFLFEKGLSPNTINTYLASLAYFFKIMDLPDLTSNFLINKMVSGARRLAASPDIRLPITLTMLKALIAALNHTCTSSYQKFLFQSMFSLAFHAFLRVGEITVRQDDDTNLLMFSDIIIKKIKSDKHKIFINMKNFKHNSTKQTAYLELQHQIDRTICPVITLRNFISVRGSNPGPLFCHRSGKAISRSEFCKLLQITLRFAKYDSTKYKSHSFRIGAATTAHLLGYSDNKIQAMGRWHSDSYRRYIRIPLLSTIHT